jgi:hypothetical protein
MWFDIKFHFESSPFLCFWLAPFSIQYAALKGNAQLVSIADGKKGGSADTASLVAPLVMQVVEIYLPIK